MRADHFNYWVLVCNQALASGLSLWGFILACEHLAYRRPTEAELLWQINVGLANSSKGIQYFTYWTPEPPEVFQQALVSRGGVLTPLYFAAQRINNDHLRPVGAQPLPLTSESVTHAGESTPPTGVEVSPGDSWVAATTGSPVVLGRFFDRADQGKRWLLVVNRSFDAAATTTLTVAPGVGAAFEFDTTGSYLPRRPEQRPGGRALDVKLTAGAARLYRLHRD